MDGTWWPAHGAVLTPDGDVLDVFGRATLAATEQKYREINDAEARHRIVAVPDMPGDVWEEIAHLHGDPLWWATENSVEMVAIYSHFARLLVQETRTAGARKPHGSSLTGRQIAAGLRGERLPPDLRRAAAAQARQLADLPSGFRRQAWYLRRWPLALAELLEGRRDGPVLTELADRAERILGYRPELPEPRFHLLEAPIADPSTGLAADAGFRRSGGVLRIYASWPDGYAAGALHELVEAELARWAGLNPRQAHTVAVLAERALATQRHRPRSWLTRRAIAELNHLAAHHRGVLLTQSAGYPGQLVHLERMFADQPGWGALATRYAERYHHAATVRARQLPRRWAAPRGPPPTRRPGRPVIKLGDSGGPSAGEAFPPEVIDAARAEDPTATCVFCGRPGIGTQVDHVIPRARGGNATLPNAQLACPHCNQSKGDQDYPLHPPLGYLGAWPPAHWPARAIGGHNPTEPVEPDKPP